MQVNGAWIKRCCVLSSITYSTMSNPLVHDMPLEAPTFVIAVTSWWVRWHLKSPASRLFTQSCIHVQIKEDIKAPHHLPLCGEFTGDHSPVTKVYSVWHINPMPINTAHPSRYAHGFVVLCSVLATVSALSGFTPAQMASNAENVSIWWRHHLRLIYSSLVWHRSPLYPGTHPQLMTPLLPVQEPPFWQGAGLTLQGSTSASRQNKTHMKPLEPNTKHVMSSIRQTSDVKTSVWQNHCVNFCRANHLSMNT